MFCLYFIQLFLILSGRQMDTKEPDLTQLLPLSITGWERTEDDNYYNEESLYNYINGGAELYISYGFKNVISRRYSKNGNSPIAVEIFDMMNSKNAYGVFTHVREETDESYGQGSQVYEDAILFWKARFYVSVVSLDGSEEAQAAIRKIAEYIDNSISENGELPGVIKIIPEKGLVNESVFYFHHPAWINSLYYISDDNILNIDNQTECVLASYGDKKDRLYLLAIEYISIEDAKQAFHQFSEAFPGEKDKQGLSLMEDGTWIAYINYNQYFLGVFHAASDFLANDLLQKTLDKLDSQGL